MRKEFFKAIGESTPDIFQSTYIIPFCHDVHSIKDDEELSSFAKTLESSGWNILNNNKADLFLHDIKQYLKDSLLPEFPSKIEEQKVFIQSKKSLVLRSKKFTSLKLKYFPREQEDPNNPKHQEFSLNLSSIDIWLLSENIGLFVFHVEQSHQYIIDQYSTIINRTLRDYKNIYALEDTNSINISNKSLENGSKLIDLCFELTKKKNSDKSFLNINSIDKEDIISQSTHYAKMLTSVYVDKKEIDINNKKFDIVESRDKLTEETSTDFNYFDELPYLLATTSSFDPSKEPTFIAHRRYLYDNLQSSSINIWRGWTGISLQDSCAFFSAKDGDKFIVLSNSTSNYFLYVMNIVTNIRLKLYEVGVIDEDFINVHKIYPLKRNLQKLKNQFIANEVSIKFQPSHIYKQMEKGLKNQEILDEISNNIDTTLDLTKQNTDAFVSAGAVLFAVGSLWEPIAKGFSLYPIITSIVSIGLVVSIIITIYKRVTVLKKIRSSIQWFIRKFELQ